MSRTRMPTRASHAYSRLVTAILFCVIASHSALGQQPIAKAIIPGGPQQGNQGNAPGRQGNGFFQGAQGGSAQADFDSLIDLIQSTVAADSWMENGTGEGEISPFAINGVYADATGTLRFDQQNTRLASLCVAAKTPPKQAQTNVRETSALRFVSLPRLEAAIRGRQSEHQSLSPEMLTLAGLGRIQYVWIVPETRDLILAGPAGDWRVRPDGIIVSRETGEAVVRLDDLLTLWRRNIAHRGQAFGCSIIPRQKAIADAQKFLQTSSSQPLEPSQRERWLQDVRACVGQQDVEFFGMASDSHVAKVLLVADYHMKLIGMGIADGVDGVTDYLASVSLGPDGNPPPMSVLRWWFAMNYEPIETNAERDLFRLRGQGVQVLSENEILAARGRRVHTGQSDELNKRFANSFTAQFEQLAKRYPLYGELRNVFDIALVLSLIEQEGLTEQIGWQGNLFVDSLALRLPQQAVPQAVETVINHRIIRRKHIVAGISGGVWLDGRKGLRIEAKASEAVARAKQNSIPAADDTQELWWWDSQHDNN